MTGIDEKNKVDYDTLKTKQDVIIGLQNTNKLLSELTKKFIDLSLVTEVAKNFFIYERDNTLLALRNAEGSVGEKKYKNDLEREQEVKRRIRLKGDILYQLDESYTQKRHELALIGEQIEFLKRHHEILLEMMKVI